MVNKERMKRDFVVSLTIMSWKVLVTRNAMLQLERTQTALAKPLALMGKISDMTSHGIGPQPRAKPEHSSSSYKRVCRRSSMKGNHCVKLRGNM